MIDERLRNRLEDSERFAAVSDLDEGAGLFDQPLQLLQIAGRPIAVPIAAATLALGEQIARVFADRLRIDGGPSPATSLLHSDDGSTVVASSASIHAASSESLSARFTSSSISRD